jgi:hypothetical protein
VLALTVVLVIVGFTTLTVLFAADSRPGPCEPPQVWFGRR